MRRRLLRPERTPLYNPQFLPEDALVHVFTAHQPLFERIVADVAGADARHMPPHKLIVGPPGGGKTMMLHRLRIAFARDADTHHPLVFPEELYGIFTVRELGQLALRRLRDSLPRGERAALADTGAPWTDVAAWSQRTGRRVVLLVDHLDRVLDRLPESEEWTLRELLQSPHFVFVGTSTTPIASDLDFGKAFYDVFQLHELRHLSSKVATQLLGKLLSGLAPTAEGGELEPALRAKIEALLLLSGGQVRTVMLLRRAIGDRRRWTIGDLAEYVLDHYTPTYRVQLERLPPQWQRAVAALAWGWHPQRIVDLAPELGLDARQLGGLLGRLVREDLVMRVGGRIGYQLADRFLNAWLVMRRGGGQRRRLRRFLELAEEVMLTQDAWEIPRLRRALERFKPSTDAPEEACAPELRRLLKTARDSS